MDAEFPPELKDWDWDQGSGGAEFPSALKDWDWDRCSGAAEFPSACETNPEGVGLDWDQDWDPSGSGHSSGLFPTPVPNPSPSRRGRVFSFPSPGAANQEGKSGREWEGGTAAGRELFPNQFHLLRAPRPAPISAQLDFYFPLCLRGSSKN